MTDNPITQNSERLAALGRRMAEEQAEIALRHACDITFRGMMVASPEFYQHYLSEVARLTDRPIDDHLRADVRRVLQLWEWCDLD